MRGDGDMPGKRKELAEEGGESQVAATVGDSAKQIWLAGMGAYSKAQKEGTKFFDSLVEEGEEFQKQAKKAAEDAFGDVKAKASKSWDQLSWSQLELAFEDGVARALHALSVPSKKDLDTLSHDVAELTKVTKKLSAAMEKPGRAR
jgi:poly(hydroxyalkanoate) granule-associated protein